MPKQKAEDPIGDRHHFNKQFIVNDAEALQMVKDEHDVKMEPNAEDTVMGTSGDTALNGTKKAIIKKGDGPGGFASVGAAGSGYNKIPRHMHDRSFTLTCKKVVRYDCLGTPEDTMVRTINNTIWISSGTTGEAVEGPGTTIDYGWKYIPNQTLECYFTPQFSSELYNMCGLNGSMNVKHCGVRVFNTRMAVTMPSVDGYLVTTDKPYFKSYEDTERILFGHGIVGGTAGNIRPSANLLTDAMLHVGIRPNMTPIQLPTYLHTVQFDATTIEPSLLQLPLETYGGVEYYQPGDNIEKSWTLSGPAMNLKEFSTAISSELPVYNPAGTTQNNAQLITGYIGGLLGNFPIARYTTPELDVVESIARSNRSEAVQTAPPMFLISSPNYTNTTVGTTQFLIQTELATTVEYTITVEVHRMANYNWATGYQLQTGLGIQSVNGQTQVVRQMDKQATAFTSRTYGKGPYTI
uniref:Uncharacterized protein n=1 Tax=Turdus hortulorum parvoviridae sp. TaxID=2794538 RepID=A0A8A4XEH0_9VIRU|nr:MAG: hypothetical protein [Turdus hortulorum parvoviridae sp.]